MHGHISSHWLRLLFGFLDERGHDAQAILGTACPEPAELRRLSAQQWRQYLELAAAKTSNPALGLQLGHSIQLKQLGTLGYAASAAQTLAEALQRLQQFDRLVYQIDPLNLHIKNGLAILEWHTQVNDPGQIVDETAIASLTTCTQQLLGKDPKYHASHVSFVNPRNAPMQAYLDVFGCKPQFNAASTQLHFPAQWLQQEVAQADRTLLAILDQQAASLLQQIPGDDPFEQDLRRAMSSAIASGDASLARMARSLNLAPRSLQRRLAERELNFQQILDDARAQLAKRYLADNSLPLSEIALLLGYSEQSAFNRAYKRWTGHSPYQSRKALLA